MKTLVYKTRQEYNDSDVTIYTIFDGSTPICEVDAETEEFLYNNGIITPGSQQLRITMTPLQRELFVKTHSVRIVIVEEIVRMTPLQLGIMHRLRQAFRDAVKEGIMFCTNSDSASLYAFNFTHLEHLMNSDGEPEYWDKEKGGWVVIPEEEKQNVIEIPEDMLEYISEGIDFFNWGYELLPWRAHLKP